MFAVASEGFHNIHGLVLNICSRFCSFLILAILYSVLSVLDQLVREITLSTEDAL